MPEQTYVDLLRRFGLVIVIAALLGAATAYYWSGQLTPTYEATTTLLVAQEAAPGEPVDLDESSRLASVFQQLVTAHSVLERVERIGVTETTTSALRDRLDVEVTPPLFLTITASGETAREAQLLSQAVSDAFITIVAEGMVTGPASVDVVQGAELPAAPTSPRRPLNAAAGGLLGLVAAASLAIVYVRLDDVVRDPTRAEVASGLPTIGLLPNVRRGNGVQQLEAGFAATSKLTEAIRAVRANLSLLMRLGDDTTSPRFERNAVLIAGVHEGVGASLSAANLALSFGRAGFTTLLIECDFRNPRFHGLFGLPEESGLATSLTRGIAPQKAISPTSYPNVSVLPAGSRQVGAVDAFGSAEMRALIERLRGEYQIVLLAAPPVLEAPDAATLAPLSDLVLLVGRLGRTHEGDLREATAAITRSGGQPAGVILNGAGGVPAGTSGRRRDLERVTRQPSVLPGERLPVGAVSRKSASD